jgi:sortase B
MMNDTVGVQIMLGSPSMPFTPDYDASQNLTGEDLEQFRPVTINKEYERIKIKLSNIKAQYPDLYGWITIPGTVINYPIMQTDNNDYYLNHSYTGASLGAGSIYADYKCKPKLMDNSNLVIYGHHMSNNSMFYSLDLYLKDSFFKSNNTIYVYTLDGMYTYKVFSVYETNKYFPYIRTYFSNDDAFNEFAQMIKEQSIHNNDEFELNALSKILTLSTCTNRSEDGRLAVHAVLTEIYESKKG